MSRGLSGLPCDCIISIMEHLKLGDIINLHEMGYSEAATFSYKKRYRAVDLSFEWMAKHFYFDNNLDPSRQFPGMITRLFDYVGHQIYDLTLDLGSFEDHNKLHRRTASDDSVDDESVCPKCPTDLIGRAPNLRKLTVIECFHGHGFNRFLEDYTKIQRHSLAHLCLRLVGGFFELSQLDNLRNVRHLHIHGKYINESDAIQLLPMMATVTDISLEATADAFEKVLFPVWGRSNQLIELTTYEQEMTRFMPHLQLMTNLKRFATVLPMNNHAKLYEKKYALSKMLCSTLEVLKLPIYTDLHLCEIIHFDRLKELRVEVEDGNVWPADELIGKQMVETLSRIPKLTVIVNVDYGTDGVVSLISKLFERGWSHYSFDRNDVTIEYRTNWDDYFRDFPPSSVLAPERYTLFDI